MNNQKTCKNIEDKKIIFLMSSILRTHKEQLFQEISPVKITKGEFPFLILLHLEGEKNQKEMAERFCFTESNAAKAIRNLEDKKLIKREIDDKNRRQKIVSLTDEGKQICKEIIAFEDKWEKSITKNLNNEEVILLKELLYKIFSESMKK